VGQVIDWVRQGITDVKTIIGAFWLEKIVSGAWQPGEQAEPPFPASCGRLICRIADKLAGRRHGVFPWFGTPGACGRRIVFCTHPARRKRSRKISTTVHKISIHG
jgi:hypothetical protein